MTESTNERPNSKTGSEDSAGQNPADNVRQAFAGLPLDQKILTLVQVELDMLGDAAESVVSAVSKAVNEVARAWESPEQCASPAPGSGEQGSTS